MQTPQLRPPRLGDYGTLHSPLHCVDDCGRMHCTLVEDCWDQNSMRFQVCKHNSTILLSKSTDLKVSLGMSHRRWGHLPSWPACHQPTQRSGRGAGHGAYSGSRNSRGRVSKFQEGTPHGSLKLVQETPWNFSELEGELEGLENENRGCFCMYFLRLSYG